MSQCRRLGAWTLLAVTVIGLTPGCQYLEMVRSRRGMRAAFAREPRLALQRTLTPEDSYRVAGRVTGVEGRDDQLLAVAVGHRFTENEVVAWKLVPRDVNLYSILLPKGDYDLLVFADVDRDGVFESSELVGSTDPAALVRVDPDASRDGFQIDGPPIVVDPAHPRASSVPVRVEVSRSHNVLPSLADDFFALRWGQRGLFHPMELLVHTQGYFFGLEEPDPDKTQVIFVHGAGGAPVEFTSLVEGLDRKRYQPWFFFYPSGLPLEQSAAVLSSVLELAVQDLGLRRVAIVAHSMGGLVAYSAVAMLCHDGLPDWLALFVSIATPYGGHDAARLGVQRAAEGGPSWRGPVPGGQFLRHLDGTPLPEALPFYIVFAYDNGARFRAAPSGDGTITLRSQLAIPVHLRARTSYGVDATHTGVLTDDTTREIVVRLLAEYAAPHGR